MAKRAILILLALAATATGETSTIAEIHPDRPLPTADYLVVIEGRAANFYAVEWPEPINVAELPAPPRSKNAMRDAALSYAVQVAAAYGPVKDSIFMIVTDQYRPPHYEAYIKRVQAKP